jgi:hypothetical protein
MRDGIAVLSLLLHSFFVVQVTSSSSAERFAVAVLLDADSPCT